MLKKLRKHLNGSLANVFMDTWESEFIDSSDNPTPPSSVYTPMDQQGLRRNPHMPLQWSQLGKLYALFGT